MARFDFDNGLRLLVAPDRSAPVAFVQTWLAVGSRHEQPGRTGMAHLFEHLMFGGTTTQPFGAFDRRIEEAGGDTNGATWLDWTYYSADVPVAALPLVLELEADRLQHLVLDPEPVEREREVVLNERRETVEDDVDELASEHLYLTGLSRHGYRHPTIGLSEDVERITIEDCRRFYRSYYAPNNATLVVVGDVAPEEAADWVERYYGAIPPSEVPVPPDDAEPEPEGARRKRLALPTDLARLVVGYRAPAVGAEDHAAVVVLNELLTGGRAGWLHRALVEEAGVAQGVSGDVGFFRDPSLWELAVLAQDEDLPPEALEEPLSSVLRSVADRIDARALDGARARLELRALQDLWSGDGRAEQLGFGEVVLDDPSWLLARIEAYRRVDQEAVIAAAERYLRPEASTTIEVVPSEDEDEDVEEA